MILSKLNTAEAFENSPECKGMSFGSLNDEIDMAIIEIHGRYPSEGFLINEICKEAVYVLSGSGTLFGSETSLNFSVGDVLYVDSEEKFAWEGDFKAVFSLTPAFSPFQHKEVDE